MLMKVIISLRNFLLGMVLLYRENVFDVNIFVLIEEMRKITTLFHHQLGGRLPTEDKLKKKTYFDKKLKKSCINFDEHSRHYNFFDARQVVSEFLTFFENMFIPKP